LLLLATLGPSPIRGELERGSFPPILGEADGGSTAVDTLLELTPAQADSLEFRLLHHYTNNFNFVVKADSLVLIPREDELYDTCKVRKDDRIAVADIRESDTIWIKVARDQFTMGWIPEDELLQGVVPDDSISQVIDSLTVSRYIWMSVLVVLGILGFVAFVLKRRGLPQLQIFRFVGMSLCQHSEVYPRVLAGILFPSHTQPTHSPYCDGRTGHPHVDSDYRLHRHVD